jgi:GT2 family glycosyltransferase
MISVVLYVHNAEEHLAELLESVFEQTFTDFEICAVDDGSTDGTGAMLDEIDDPRLRVLHIPGNGRDGLHRTFNRCLSMARGDLIAIANGDDVWRPEKLERQIAEFAADDQLDVCYHDATIIDAESRVTLGTIGRRPVLHAVDGPPARHYLAGDPVPNPTVMFRRDIVRVIGAQETGWVHDYQFWMKAALAGCRFRGLPDRLIKYRVHEGGHSTGSKRRSRIATESLAMVRAMVERSTIVDLYPELTRCDDGPLSLAYAHMHLGIVLARVRQPELAAVHLGMARRIAPTSVGEGDKNVRWFGTVPQIVDLLREEVPMTTRLRLPAARTVLALPDDVDDASIEGGLRRAFDDPLATTPMLVLTDADVTTARAADAYERILRASTSNVEPHVELYQVRPGEMESVVQGNLFDGGTLLQSTGGPLTDALMTVDWIPVPDLSGQGVVSASR